MIVDGLLSGGTFFSHKWRRDNQSQAGQNGSLSLLAARSNTTQAQRVNLTRELHSHTSTLTYLNYTCIEFS